MRVLFLGTPEFAVPTLKELLESHHEVVGAVTRPDRRRERRGRPSPSPVCKVVAETGLPLLQPERVNMAAVYDDVRALRPDVAVVVAFGQLLSRPFLALPSHGCVNLHASLLPRWRGAAPIQWSVTHGDTETGLTTMQMDAGMDTGDILLQIATSIGPDETASQLAARLAALGGSLMVETLDGLAAGSLEPRPQEDRLATYARLLRKENGRIQWTDDPVTIVNLVRGIQPWPIAHTLLGDQAVRVFRALPLETPAVTNDVAPGTIVGLEGDQLVVATGAGPVGVCELQLPSRKRMTGREAINGRALRVGSRLS